VTFWVNAGAKIVYLPQQPDIVEDHTVLEQVFADAGEKMALIREYEDISHHIAHGEGDQDALMKRLSAVTEKIDAADAWDLETNAKVILSKLGIEDFDARIGDLSGGLPQASGHRRCSTGQSRCIADGRAHQPPGR
jgi:ATP-binding cassette subfamily F protein uup